MKKVIVSLALGIAMAVPSVQAKVPAYDANAQLAAARADIGNWMKYLPDDMFVAHVSIPGSHDSATGHNVTLPSFSMAQEVLLEDQLKGGIRAFDFRPGFYTEDVEIDGTKVTVPYVNCNHGSSKTDLRMEQAFDILVNYLKEHPSEFLAMHLFRGYPTSDPAEAVRDSYDEAIGKIFNEGKFADFFVDFDPYLTVKQMRGKIVVFRRDRIAWCHINKAGNLTEWPGDQDLWEEGAAATVTNALNPTLTARIKVTDVSSPKKQELLDKKLQSITNLFNSNCKQLRPNEAKAKGDYKPEWSMIFTSGEGLASGKKGYLTCSTYTNPLLTKLINEAEIAGPTGIVLSDWVLIDNYKEGTTDYEMKSNDMLKAIIENNFKYASDYILDDELFNDEKDIKSDEYGLGGKTLFLRNAETGKMLAAGADWGTHAVLAGNGIRITPFFDNRTGKYLLKTTFRQGGVDNYLGGDCYIDNTAPHFMTVVKAEDADAFYLTFNGVDGENNTTVFALATESAVNQYADGTATMVNYLKFEKGNKSQMWEFIAEGELVEELAAKATMDNPADLTFMIRGYKLDPNDDDENGKWILKNELAKNSTTYCMKTQVWGSNDYNDKDMIFRVYADKTSTLYPENYSWELSQEVAGLPEGLYTVTAKAMVDNMPVEGEGCFEMAANGVDMAKGIHVETTGAFTCDKGSALDVLRDEKSLVKAENVEVGNDGKLLIRMAKPLKTASGKQNFFFDNFALKYHGKKIGSSVAEIGEEVTVGPETVVDVYTVSGVMVAGGVRYGEAFNELGRGVYIVRSANATVKVMK